MKDKKYVTLQTFLIRFVLFAVVLTLLFVVIYVSNSRKFKGFSTFRNDIETLTHLFQVDYEAQLLFFNSYHSDEIFFRTKKNKYLRRHNTLYPAVAKLTDSLINTRLARYFKIDKKLGDFLNFFSEANNDFNLIVDLLYKRGYKNTGLISKIVENQKLALEEIDKLPLNIKSKLFNVFSSLNTHFYKYLEHPSVESYQEFLTDFLKIQKVLNQAPSVSDTASVNDSVYYLHNTATVSKELITALNKYKHHFNQLYNLDKQIGFVSEEGALQKWEEDINTAVELIKTASQDLYPVFTQKFKQNVILFTFLIFALYFGVLVILIWIVFRFTRFAKVLNNYISPMEYGVLPKLIDTEKVGIRIYESQNLFNIVNKIINSLKEMSQFAVEIGKGNFDYQFEPMSDKDILGNALLQLRDNLKKAKEEQLKREEQDKINKWISDGITKFSELLRQTTEDLEKLSSVIIKNLVDYLDANQGGIFLLNDDDPENKFLELVASYAYSKERKKKKIFLLGEGLVGTAAIEKGTIYLTEIPEDYISITSGLGGANPRSLLIVPLLHEEQLLGIIEIASFQEMKKYQIEFVEKVAESIAATVSINKINRKTAILLEQSKKQAEEMAAKEEEMRQNLEELQATQEEAARREAELNSILNALKTFAHIFELDLDGNIISVDDNIIKFYNLPKTYFLGQHFSIIDASEPSPLADPQFWEEVKQGKVKVYMRKFNIEDKEYWFEDHISPVYDTKGNVYKLIVSSLEITEKVKQQQILEHQKQLLEKRQVELEEKIKEQEAIRKHLEEEKQKADILAERLKNSEKILKKALIKAQEDEEKWKNVYKKIRESNIRLAKSLEDVLAITEIRLYLKNREIEDFKKKK